MLDACPAKKRKITRSHLPCGCGERATTVVWTSRRARAGGFNFCMIRDDLRMMRASRSLRIEAQADKPRSFSAPQLLGLLSNQNTPPLFSILAYTTYSSILPGSIITRSSTTATGLQRLCRLNVPTSSSYIQALLGRIRLLGLPTPQPPITGLRIAVLLFALTPLFDVDQLLLHCPRVMSRRPAASRV